MAGRKIWTGPGGSLTPHERTTLGESDSIGIRASGGPDGWRFGLIDRECLWLGEGGPFPTAQAALTAGRAAATALDPERNWVVLPETPHGGAP